MVHFVLLEGYESLVSLPLLLPADATLWRPPLRDALALALVGASIWGGHWFRLARGDTNSSLRLVYLYVFAILGGILTALVALGLLLNAGLAWILGAVDETAAVHFRLLPAAVATLGLGVALWYFHWSVARREAEISPRLTRTIYRAYAYVLAGIGLGALVLATGTAVDSALAVLTEGSRELLAGRDLWRGPIAVSITLAILGAPLWGRFWAAMQRQAAVQGAEERQALPRRLLIFGVLGAGMLALLASISALIFFFLRDLLAEDLSMETVRSSRPAVGVIVTTAIFLPYHWLVYRQDRRAAPEDFEATERRRRKDVTVLVKEGGNTFVQDLEAALGYRVDVLLWADSDALWPQLTESQSEELAERVGSAPGQRVLLVPGETTVRVLSYN